MSEKEHIAESRLTSARGRPPVVGARGRRACRGVVGPGPALALCPTPGTSWKQMDEKRRARLVQQIRRMGIRNGRLWEAVERVDRADYVPPGLSPREVYQDAPVGIGQGQTTSQPSLVAQMIDALELDPADAALEIGTGFGYQTALLASVCATVVSVERYSELARQAHTNLAAAGFENVRVVTGDGTQGVPEEAPFDGIVVSAAAPDVPPALVEQLADGGRMVIPLGPGGREVIVVYEKHQGSLRQIERMTAAAFVPLVPGEE